MEVCYSTFGSDLPLLNPTHHLARSIFNLVTAPHQPLFASGIILLIDDHQSGKHDHDDEDERLLSRALQRLGRCTLPPIDGVLGCLHRYSGLGGVKFIRLWPSPEVLVRSLRFPLFLLFTPAPIMT